MDTKITSNMSTEEAFRAAYQASTLTGDELDSVVRELVQDDDFRSDPGDVVKIGAALGVSATLSDVQLALDMLHARSNTADEFALALSEVTHQYPDAMRAIIGSTKANYGAIQLMSHTLEDANGRLDQILTRSSEILKRLRGTSIGAPTIETT